MLLASVCTAALTRSLLVCSDELPARNAPACTIQKQSTQGVAFSGHNNAYNSMSCEVLHLKKCHSCVCACVYSIASQAADLQKLKERLGAIKARHAEPNCSTDSLSLPSARARQHDTSDQDRCAAPAPDEHDERLVFAARHMGAPCLLHATGMLLPVSMIQCGVYVNIHCVAIFVAL